jgi:hypothetical protein
LLLKMKILYTGTVSENLHHLGSIAECFGVTADLVEVRPDYPMTTALKQTVEHGDRGIVLDVESLKRSVSQEVLQEVVNFMLQHSVVLLLLVTDDDEATNQFIRTLTGGGVASVSRAACAGSVGFPASGGSFSRELCSQSYARQEKEALILRQDAKSTPIMELDGRPSFAFFTAGQSQIMVWSTPSIFDVHRPLVAEIEFELATDEYIPAIIFLRSAFGDQCWHNPEPAAGIVIDDPLLQKRYGYIDFGELLQSARKHGYHITLAFIPWNHWRSRSSEIQLFLDHSDCFSVCAHGCDHIDNEYGSTDYDLLLSKNFVASERMSRHSRRTGLQSEALMVCPQEKYSMEAMGAFSDSRQFLGLICTACMPRNLASPQLSAADLLLPAQDSFFGFSVFKRHYSGNMAVFAMALFLVKPAILVEHHEFFRNGPGGLEDFARRLALLRPDIQWRSLAETVMRTHARRRVSEGKWEVRFFTDTFELEHRLESSIRYRLLRRLPDTTVVNRVLVDGRDVPFSRVHGFLSFEIEARIKHTFSVQVEVPPIKPTKTQSSGVGYQTSVALRRALSEMRDNLMVRNRFALNAGRLIVNTVKNTTRQRNGSARP